MDELLNAIIAKIDKQPLNKQFYTDMALTIEVLFREKKIKKAIYWGKILSSKLEDALKVVSLPAMAEMMYGLQRELLKKMALYDFESYMLFCEWDRKTEKSFYLPRREQLAPIAAQMQKLADGKLDLLCLSLPPGVGKTTIATFFLTWLAGKDPSRPILTASHSNGFIDGVYDETLRILQPNGEYLWAELFDKTKVTHTNAKGHRIDLGKRKRFETLEFTSIGTGNAGLYRAEQLLYCDDLVSGMEVALSEERLEKLWNTYTTDLRQRKMKNAKELHIATRWSVRDVIGRLEVENDGNPRAAFVSEPALDENDESNFDYLCDVGFDTKFYHDQREIMDEASWKALFMNEPIEREGLVYRREELRRYFSLPSEEPDAVLAVCDTKDKGKDYCFMPIVLKYGQDHYVVDCICDNGLPDVVDDRLTDCLVRNQVKMCRFESNSAGRRIAEKVQDGVKEKEGITQITTKYTTANKETKIIVNSAWVKEHCIFKDESMYRRSDEYGRMIEMLCTYTLAGRNAHDDVPDGMAQYAEFAQALDNAKVEIIQRPW